MEAPRTGNIEVWLAEWFGDLDPHLQLVEALLSDLEADGWGIVRIPTEELREDVVKALEDCFVDHSETAANAVLSKVTEHLGYSAL